MVGIRQFGHHVEFFAGRVGIGNRTSGLPFVSVGRSGVDMSVTGAQRGNGRLLGVRRGDLEDSEPDDGDRIAVIQRDHALFEGAAYDEESASRAGPSSGS